MTDSGNQTQEIQLRLDRLQAGDEAARRELINCACQRLERLTRKMFRGWERVHRWEETADVLQNASLRLYRALADVKPANVVDFFRLAALNIRRELFDLAKHYYGPRGLAANHATGQWRGPTSGDATGAYAWDPVGDAEDPAHLSAWAEFHARIDELPDDERVVFDLLWYQELSQIEAAHLLGISERTLKRRWAAARLRLHAIIAMNLPDCPPDLEPLHVAAPSLATPSQATPASP